MSLFSMTGKAEASDEMSDMPIDEHRMEKAMQMLASEAANINEDDPRQAADLMRKMTDMTGLELGSGMEEALRRLERGEDPDAIEAEMGDLLESEDPFQLRDKKAGARAGGRRPPMIDETLYDL